MIEILAAYGLAGAFALAFAERVVPVIPSYALFALIGVAAAQTDVSIALFVAAATIGSVLGGLLLFELGRLFERGRAERVAARVGRWFAVKSHTTQRWLDRVAAYGGFIVGFGQLVPTIRLLTPFFAGLLHSRRAHVVFALAVGSLAWVAAFSGVAWFSALRWPEVDPIQLTLTLTAALFAVEFAVGAAWAVGRRLVRRTTSAAR